MGEKTVMLKEGRGFRTFEKKVLRRIFGLKWKK
jgi:hypothetical protein